MISSVSNPRIQRVGRLRKRERRERARRLLVEGHHGVTAALAAGALEQVLYVGAAERRHGAVLAEVRSTGAEATEVTPEVMAHLTSSSTAPSMLGVARIPGSAIGSASTGVLLADVRDPATVGSLLALCAAVGGQAAVVLPGCADAFAPKVVRAAAGAHFATRVVRVTDRGEALGALRANGAAVVALAEDAPPPWDVELAERMVLLIADDGVAGDADVLVGVPADRVRPSLALRAAVVLYEWVRQGGAGA